MVLTTVGLEGPSIASGRMVAVVVIALATIVVLQGHFFANF